MAKKQKCPEFENHERWLVAYADMMTLLFALFVVLYSIANVEVDKLKKVSSSIQKAFGMSETDATVPDPDATIATTGDSLKDSIFDHLKGNTRRRTLLHSQEQEALAITMAADQKAIERKLTEELKNEKIFKQNQSIDDGQDNSVFVTRDHDGIRISLLARRFFPPGQTMIDKSAKKILDGIATSIKGFGKTIRIEGHTDNLPFQNNGMTNWELSSSRAASVVRYLISEHSFEPSLIYASGFADTRPIAPNDTPKNRSLNRRVDIKILYDDPVD